MFAVRGRSETRWVRWVCRKKLSVGRDGKVVCMSEYEERFE